MYCTTSSSKIDSGLKELRVKLVSLYGNGPSAAGGAESRGKPCGVCGAADFFKQWASNPFSSSGWGLLLSYCQSAMSYSDTRTQQCSYSVLRKKKTRSALLSAQSVVVGEGTNWWTWQLIQDQSSVLMHSRRTHQEGDFKILYMMNFHFHTNWPTYTCVYFNLKGVGWTHGQETDARFSLCI